MLTLLQKIQKGDFDFTDKEISAMPSPYLHHVFCMADEPLRERYAPTLFVREGHSAKDLFRKLVEKASALGQLDTLKWLKAKIDKGDRQTWEDIIVHGNYVCFTNACRNGHADVVRWFLRPDVAGLYSDKLSGVKGVGIKACCETGQDKIFDILVQDAKKHGQDKQILWLPTDSVMEDGHSLLLVRLLVRQCNPGKREILRKLVSSAFLDEEAQNEGVDYIFGDKFCEIFYEKVDLETYRMLVGLLEKRNDRDLVRCFFAQLKAGRVPPPGAVQELVRLTNKFGYEDTLSDTFIHGAFSDYGRKSSLLERAAKEDNIESFDEMLDFADRCSGKKSVAYSLKRSLYHGKRLKANSILSVKNETQLKMCERVISYVFDQETGLTKDDFYPEDTAEHFISTAQTQLREAEALRPREAGWRWLRTTRREPPAKELTSFNPHAFKPALYERLLPLMELACAIENNSDAAAQACKLATLFSSEQEVNRFLARDWKNYGGPFIGQPVHDACLFSLPEGKEADRWRWQQKLWKVFALRYGREATKFLSRGTAIEAKLAEMGKPFPRTLREMREVAVFCAYDRADEHQAWAEIAFSVGQSNGNFVEGLAILAAQEETVGRNKNDGILLNYIPDVTIDGAKLKWDMPDSVGSGVVLSDFYMVRLAKDDPRGLILGAYSDCCQSLGLAGASCARHGMTSAYSGFYVWKQKTGGQMTPDDPIVAQSWAWLPQRPSHSYNLVLDSFERCEHKYGVLAAPFISALADKIDQVCPTYVYEDEKREIFQVKLGIGGNTPQLDWKRQDSVWPPIGYDDYSDAKAGQYLVPSRSQKLRHERQERKALAACG